MEISTMKISTMKLYIYRSLGQSQKLPNRFFQQHGEIEESFAGVVSNVRQ